MIWFSDPFQATTAWNILSVLWLILFHFTFKLKAQWSILGSKCQDFTEKQSFYFFLGSISEKNPSKKRIIISVPQETKISVLGKSNSFSLHQVQTRSSNSKTKMQLLWVIVTHKFSQIYSKIRVYYKLKLGPIWESLSLSSAEHTDNFNTEFKKHTFQCILTNFFICLQGEKKTLGQWIIIFSFASITCWLVLPETDFYKGVITTEFFTHKPLFHSQHSMGKILH